MQKKVQVENRLKSESVNEKLGFVQVSFSVFDCNVKVQVEKYNVFSGVWLAVWKCKRKNWLQN